MLRRNAGYTLRTLPVYTLTSGNISQIKLVFAHQSSAGVIWIDDISLIHTIPAIISREDALSLPAAPDSFRGEN